jgi:DNA-binding transcriptional ArsR family regulator
VGDIGSDPGIAASTLSHHLEKLKIEGLVKVKRLHREFEDPAAFSGSEEERLAVFRRVRDELRIWLADFEHKKT